LFKAWLGRSPEYESDRAGDSKAEPGAADNIQRQVRPDIDPR
jgi:hypothetical protein